MTNSMNTSHNYVKLFFQMSLESTGNENPIFVKTKDTWRAAHIWTLAEFSSSKEKCIY